jgi:hypothetical protein
MSGYELRREAVMTLQTYEVAQGYDDLVPTHQATIRPSSPESGLGKADRVVDPGPNDTTWPLLICVLGTFRVLVWEIGL